MRSTIDRRFFLSRVAALAIVAPIAQVLRPTLALAAPDLQGFRFIHDDSVAIVLDFAKKDDRYDLTVRVDGSDVEFFPNAHPMRFHGLRTDYFTVEYFDPVAEGADT